MDRSPVSGGKDWIDRSNPAIGNHILNVAEDIRLLVVRITINQHGSLAAGRRLSRAKSPRIHKDLENDAFEPECPFYMTLAQRVGV